MLRETIRLDMNEVPYLPPRGVLEAAQKGLSSLNRYTEPKDLERLRDLLADYSQVAKEHIVLSPGSDLLLREAIHAFAKGRKVVTVSPSFFPTVQAAKEFATERLSIRLSSPGFDLDLGLLNDVLSKPTLVIIDNPNNPTGQTLLDRQAVETLVRNPNALLVIDEAYYEFSGLTLADMVPNCPNLAITRTMDKAFSLAGARVGYAIAGRIFLDALSSFYAFLPQSSLLAAIEALNNRGYVGTNVQRVIEERERLWSALHEQGTHVYPSTTNFLLINTGFPDAASRLEEIGIRVSDLSNQLPAGFIRVSIGTPEENDAFIGAYMRIRDSHD
jgi:histidinol-phosphate aminotransferase